MERIQRRVTRMAKGKRELPHEERLRRGNISSLELHGDHILTRSLRLAAFGVLKAPAKPTWVLPPEVPP